MSICVKGGKSCKKVNNAKSVVVDRKLDLQIQSNGLAALQRLDAKLCSVESEMAELRGAQEQVLKASDSSLQIAFDHSHQSLQVSSLL